VQKVVPWVWLTQRMEIRNAPALSQIRYIDILKLLNIEILESVKYFYIVVFSDIYIFYNLLSSGHEFGITL